MKLTIVLIIATLVQVSATGLAQNITFVKKDATLKQLFNEINKQTGYSILWSGDNTGRTFNANFRKTPLTVVLKQTLSDLELTYTIEDKTIVVSEKSPPLFGKIESLAVAIDASGRVVDSKGQPMAGATVTLKADSKVVVSTDSKGYYTIKIPENSILVFSSVGYKTVEIPVRGKQVPDVVMESEPRNLNEIVVVGYGTQKRATLTGSIARVDSKSFEDKGSVANPLQALQGQVPGVIITRKSAAPGNEGWNIQIRGAASVNPTDALVIIDGVAAVGISALDAINPSDIESMSFLKDASAAIYGARAAGGVILITTKKAKSGKTNVQYDGSVSEKFVGLQPRLMNVQQWAEGVIAARTNDGFDSNDIWIGFGRLALKNLGGYYDVKATGINPLPSFSDVSDYVFFDNSWTDILWGRAASTQNSISISGRGEKAGYRLSVGYMGDGSLLKWGNNSNKRYDIRLNNDFLISDKVKVESNISYENNYVVTPTMLNAVLGQYAQPGMPILALNGNPYAWGGNLNPNSQAELGGDNRVNKANLYINEKLTYDITNSLKFITTLGYSNYNTNRYEQSNSIQWYNYLGTIPGVINPTQSVTYFKRGTAIDNYYTANAYLQYKTSLKTNNDIGVTLGGQYERDEYDFHDGTVFNTLSPGLQTLGGIGARTNTELKNHYAISSLFSRINYAYKEKYLFEANLRYDGSSKFDAANRWKFFYGLSAGWRIKQESFMKSVTFFDELKLRASYGVVGNPAGIQLYDYIQLLSLGVPTTVTSANPLIGPTQAVTVGPEGTLVSLGRTWEKIKNSNVAVDFSILDNRLSGTAEYYEKENSNMLLRQTFPSVLGASAPAANIGHLKTKGWEISLTWGDKINQFSYYFGGNLTYNTNKLINLNGSTVITSGYNAATQGYPIGSVFGLEYAGRIQTKQQLDDYITKYNNGNSIGISTNLKVGDNMFKDINGDGKLTADDYTYLGTDDPRYSYSFNFGGQWKGFDFSAIFQGVGKRTIFRNGNVWRIPFSAIYLNTTTQSVNNNWTIDNPNAYYPRYSNNGTVNNHNYQSSSWSVENGAYMRIKNVVLGYSLPDKLLKRTNLVSRLRVYVSGNDLWEISHIKDGWDPEAPSNVITTDNTPYYGRYPFYRYLTFGVNVNF